MMISRAPGRIPHWVGSLRRQGREESVGRELTSLLALKMEWASLLPPPFCPSNG